MDDSTSLATAAAENNNLVVSVLAEQVRVRTQYAQGLFIKSFTFAVFGHPFGFGIPLPIRQAT